MVEAAEDFVAWVKTLDPATRAKWDRAFSERAPDGQVHFPTAPPYRFRYDAIHGRQWISGGVVAAGLALAAVDAWPRRRHVEAGS